MQFTTTLIASILAVAATAAPGAAAAADVEKRQDVGCLLACLGVSAKLQCVTNAGSINELIGCAAGNTALVCCEDSLFSGADPSLSRSADAEPAFQRSRMLSPTSVLFALLLERRSHEDEGGFRL